MNARSTTRVISGFASRCIEGCLPPAERATQTGCRHPTAMARSPEDSPRDETRPESPATKARRSQRVLNGVLPAGSAIEASIATQPLSPLAAARRFAGLSELEVAERMDVEPNRVIRLEAGAEITLAELEAYAEALGGQLEVRVHLPGWSYRIR